MDELLKQIADLRQELNSIVEKADSKEEVQKAFSTVGEQIKALEEKLDDAMKADEEAQRSLDEAKAAIAEKEEAVKNLTESLENAIKEKDAKEEVIKSHKEELRQKGVEAFCKELSDKGLWPATVAVVKDVLMASSSEKVVTLSEGEGEDKKDVEVDLKGVIDKIVASIPEDFKVKMSEESDHGEADTGEYTAEKIQKLADEAKMTYGEMLIKLSQDKKI
jgi:hypothetical protein